MIETLVLALATGLAVDAPIQRAVAGDVELHYISAGDGEPVVLIHGSLADYRYWLYAGQVEPLAGHFHAIAYSRRYNHPNRNAPVAAAHSALVEAEDLGRFLDALGVGPVHLIGHSYGAYTALLFALADPERVRSLVLAEPPILPWLPDIDGGAGIEQRFMERVWTPLATAFRDGGVTGGLGFTARWYFNAEFEDIEPEWQTLFRDNVAEWHALAVSPHAFPMVDYGAVGGLRMRTLLLSGAKGAGGMNDLIDRRLHQLIPGAERVVIPDASHEMFLDAPEATARALLEFLQRVD